MSVLVHASLLAAAAAAVFLAGGAAQGSLGIFLSCAGVVLMICPAQRRVEWPLWNAVGGLLACGALAFLPARWFATPPWRAALAGAPAIHLPGTVSPVPWETGFWLTVLGLSCLTGLFLLAHPIRSRAALGLSAAAVLTCGVYAGLSIYARQTGWHYPYSANAAFGFFPNRNHTATFLVTGSIVALGVLTVALRDRRWKLAAAVAAAMAACVAGLFFFSASRGGVIFLVVGTLVWAGGLGRSHRHLPLVVSLSVLALAVGMLFLLSGGEARSRLLRMDGPKTVAAATPAPAARASDDPLPGSEQDAPFDFRVLIYRDTFKLIEDAPITGTGLGAFAPVFAHYRNASLNASASIHPESDWLMLAAEAGVPALVFAFAAGVLLFLRLRGANAHPFWPLRWACVAAATAAALHGIIDVPAHRVALGWWVLLLAGLGFHTAHARAGKSSWVQRVLFILGGVGALGLGVQLIRAEWFHSAPLPPYAAGRAREEILALYNRQQFDEATDRAQSAVEAAPMAAPLYYQLGVLLLRYQGLDADVDRAFQAQRLLNPTWPSVPLAQGDAWLAIDPKRTAALWLKALERERRIDLVQAGKPPNPEAFFAQLVDRARSSVAVQRELSAAAARSPDFLLTWMEHASPAAVRDELAAILQRAPLLEQFSPAQKEKFLLLWYAKADRDALTAFVSAHGEWRTAATPVHLRQLVDAGDFEHAVREAAAHYQVSLDVPPALPADEHAVPSPDDPIAAFGDAWRTGNTVAARRILDEAAANAEKRPVPPEVWRLRAAFAVRGGSWPEAWDNLRAYLRLTAPDSVIP